MFAQFYDRYPTGCLISELVTVYHGKYVVRVSIQVDGVTRSTGMAQGDTIEAAEDLARIRALEIMGIRSSKAIDTQKSTGELIVPPTLEQQRSESIDSGSISTDIGWLGETNPLYYSGTTFGEPSHIGATPAASAAVKGNMDWQRDDYIPNSEITSSADRGETAVSYGKVTSIASRRSDREIDPVPLDRLNTETDYSPTEQTVLNSPVDSSELIARIGVAIKRLGWSNKQGSDYLYRTYGKKTRHDLSNEELQDFLDFLESQPSPDI